MYTLPGKNFGYAKFGTTEAAEECKKTLHRANIAGCSLKVGLARREGNGDDDEDGSDDVGLEDNDDDETMIKRK